MRKRIAVLALLWLLAPTLTAGTQIRVGILPLTSHGPSMIAETRGYFAEQGLDVELVRFQAAQPMSVAIASGDVDFGVTAVTGSLIALAGHGAVRVIGGAVQERPDVRGQQILVSRAAHEAGLHTPADLAGARFGVTTIGSSFHYMAHRIVDAEGIARERLRLVPLHRVAAVIAALRSGQIDAWTIVPNVAAGLLESGDVVSLGAVSDYLPDYQVTTVFAAARLLDAQPQVAERFLTAFARGIDDYNAALVLGEADADERRAIVQILHQHVYAERPLAAATDAILAGAMWINPGATLNLDSLRDQLEWFQSANLVPQDVSLTVLVDRRFVTLQEPD